MKLHQITGREGAVGPLARSFGGMKGKGWCRHLALCISSSRRRETARITFPSHWPGVLQGAVRVAQLAITPSGPDGARKRGPHHRQLARPAHAKRPTLANATCVWCCALAGFVSPRPAPLVHARSLADAQNEREQQKRHYEVLVGGHGRPSLRRVTLPLQGPSRACIAHCDGGRKRLDAQQGLMQGAPDAAAAATASMGQRGRPTPSLIPLHPSIPLAVGGALGVKYNGYASPQEAQDAAKQLKQLGAQLAGCCRHSA